MDNSRLVHGNVIPMEIPWDGIGINCYGMGMRQINTTHCQCGTYAQSGRGHHSGPMWAAHVFYWAAFTGPHWVSSMGPIHKLATGIIMDPCRLLMY